MNDKEKITQLRAAIQLLLDQVDYTVYACHPTNMVAACLDTRIITKVKNTLNDCTP